MSLVAVIFNPMRKFLDYLIITIGVSILSLGLALFLIPHKIAAGGISGVGIILFYLFGINVGYTIFFLNLILFVLGFRILGRSFGFKTIYATLAYSAIVAVLSRILPPEGVTDDMILNVLFGCFLSGAGMAIVFSREASTGGTDIIAMILKKLVNLDVSWGLLIVDFTITLFAGVFFGKDIGMYALLGVIVNTFTIDTVLAGVTTSIQVMIISDRYERIKERILNDVRRGATLLHGEGAFTGKDRKIILTVLRRKEFVRLKGIVKEEDPDAFLLVSHVREVLGEGFKPIE